MNPPASGASPPESSRRIEVNVRTLDQLFNTMDHSPFHEKDLDQDAEDFIVGWAQEFPLRDPIELRVYVATPADPTHPAPAPAPAPDPDPDPQRVVARAIHHYFQERARVDGRDLRQLMREGRFSLMIGLVFLGTCLSIGEMIGRHDPGTLLNLLRESLTIVGWVALWRPIEIYLYDWWPIVRLRRIHSKLAHMPVTVQSAPSAPSA